MRPLRLVARLDIKGPNLIKGVNLEGLKIIGEPNKYALKYYENGIDELIFMDVVASLYGRNQLSEIIKKATKNVFIPITVGGGIRSVEDAKDVLRFGADKIAINSAAIKNPKLIRDLANKFGSQSVVLSIEAKRIKTNFWEAYSNNGRERSGLNVIEWIKKGVANGAGEILLTSVDQEGTGKGFDIDLINIAMKTTQVPIILSGGMGKIEHMIEVVKEAGIEALAMADVFHTNKISVEEIRKAAIRNNLNVRKLNE
tara:strand:+ start:30821 stop:31588 length:768 start_codon:yes stop_codon:yes gene_type:complete